MGGLRHAGSRNFDQNETRTSHIDWHAIGTRRSATVHGETEMSWPEEVFRLRANPDQAPGCYSLHLYCKYESPMHSFDEFPVVSQFEFGRA